MSPTEKIPSLSTHAKVLLLAAENGLDNLLLWYTKISQAWNELPIINEQYGGGFIKCRWGKDQIALTGLDGELIGQEMSFHHGEEVVEIEKWREYHFAHNAHSLFQCFFKVFPEIDNVDTEHISGLGFKNPFRLMNLKEIERQQFFDHARECYRSDKFHEEWQKRRSNRATDETTTRAPGARDNEKPEEDYLTFSLFSDMEKAFNKISGRRTIQNHARKVLSPTEYKMYFKKRPQRNHGIGKNKYSMPVSIFQKVYKSLHDKEKIQADLTNFIK